MSRYLTDEELSIIRASVPKYGGGHMKALIAEVETLRAAERDAEDAERGAAACDQIVALLDGFPVEAPCPEAARVAALLAEVDALRAGLANIEQIVRDGMAVARAEGVAEIERLRADVAYLRACVPPVHPADYGHEAWAEAIRAAVAAERAAVVAWLRALTVEWSPGTVAYAIERGEHRREEK